jgi:hypothetical protein
MWPFNKKNWEVKISEVQKGHNIFYLVQREIKIINQHETRIYTDINLAQKKFEEWMS